MEEFPLPSGERDGGEGDKYSLYTILSAPRKSILAEKINAKQENISRYEIGASLPSIKTPVKIAKVLKKSAGYFLER